MLNFVREENRGDLIPINVQARFIPDNLDGDRMDLF